jgi:hypothetical protein
MGWITTGGSIVNGEVEGLDGVVVSNGSYYETRTKPGDDDTTQVRPHLLVTTEFRGLNYAHAAELSGAYLSGSKTVTRTATPIAGGGYILTQTSDAITDVWTDLT